MKLALIVFFALFLFACAAPGQVSVNAPQGKSDRYPPEIAGSTTRRQDVQDAWKTFLDEIGLPFSKLDLEPVIDTPRSLPAELAAQINVTKKSGAFGEMEAKEALRSFIESVRGIVGGDPKSNAFSVKDLSLISFIDDGKFYRIVYRQMTYPFPIANDYGELRITVDKKARLLQWNSRLIPTLSLPTAPSIDRGEIVDRLIGREFPYTTISGQPQSVRITKREEIAVKDMVVYPKLDGDKLALRLAYPVEVGSGTTWTVYIDAIDGSEIGVRQNFAS